MAVRMFVVGFAVLLAACGDTPGEAAAPAVESSPQERQPVLITYERSGGIAGITRSVTLSTDDLTEDRAAELRRLIDDAGFFDLPEEIAGDGSVADDFTYVIVVESGSNVASVTAADAAVPEDLRPLLDWLDRAARSGG